jgi:hypothetical protein
MNAMIRENGHCPQQFWSLSADFFYFLFLPFTFEWQNNWLSSYFLGESCDVPVCSNLS